MFGWHGNINEREHYIFSWFVIDLVCTPLLLWRTKIPFCLLCTYICMYLYWYISNKCSNKFTILQHACMIYNFLSSHDTRHMHYLNKYIGMCVAIPFHTFSHAHIHTQNTLFIYFYTFFLTLLCIRSAAANCSFAAAHWCVCVYVFVLGLPLQLRKNEFCAKHESAQDNFY